MATETLTGKKLASLWLSVVMSLIGSPAATLASGLPVGAAAQPFSADAPIDRQTYQDYLLGVGDKVSVKFFNVPEYNGEIQILVDGTLSLPLIGKVKVEGLSIPKATDRIAAAYAPYLKNPGISLDITTPRPLNVGISGEVHRPGSYAIATGTSGWPSLINALQLAGGITERANIKSIQVQRRGPDNRETTLSLDLSQIIKSGDTSQNISLRDRDAIYIPTANNLTPTELTQL
ncbi:MAG: polysaccharide biosynthesis/export family protein, partial [Nodosilinea sp.]